jgi:surface antigen
MQKALMGASALLLSACMAGQSDESALPGANPGVVVGSPVASGSGEPVLGVVEGGLMGADVGRSLGEEERNIALKAEYEALEYGRAGEQMTWQSPTSDTRGEIVVGATYTVNQLDCREYSHRIYIGGRLRAVRGTACRQPDGVWRIVG